MQDQRLRITRRTFAAGLSACVLSGAAGPGIARAETAPTPPRLAEDGMYEFDWYLESFLELADDVATAAQKGKTLAVMFGQRACPYCKRMAEEHLMKPEIVGYIRDHFEILHLNLYGAREVTDFDGKKLSEREFARAYGVRLTPTIMFFPKETDGLAAKPAMKREVARMPGLLEPPQFLAMFRYVEEGGYRASSFPDWLKTRS